MRFGAMAAAVAAFFIQPAVAGTVIVLGQPRVVPDGVTFFGLDNLVYDPLIGREVAYTNYFGFLGGDQIPAGTFFGIKGLLVRAAPQPDHGTRILGSIVPDYRYTNMTFSFTYGDAIRAINDEYFYVAEVRLGQWTVPEPSTWAMLIMGFGFIGGVMRQRRFAMQFSR